MPSSIAVGAGSRCCGQQRISLGLHRLDLFEQNLKAVEFAVELGSDVARERAAIAGPKLFQALAAITT
jgi:hypothetical protein